jgi:uncharacterized alpha-E superfamily protein
MSAYQMYRQHVRRRVHGPDVIEFVLKDTLFPRAVGCCLSEVDASLAVLPRPQLARERAQRVLRLVQSAATDKLEVMSLHQLMDELQIDIAAIDNAIRSTWFLPEEAYA